MGKTDQPRAVEQTALGVQGSVMSNSAEGIAVDASSADGNICLVCLEDIGPKDPIWSCHGCYTSFHIVCIQKWARQFVNLLSANNQQPAPQLWSCPKCRLEYKEAEQPSRYYCYCSKQVDPRPDAWTLPHSCGQTCSRLLSRGQNGCEHRCQLLCHPGPCPPCAQTVKWPCYCGGSKELQARRCADRFWSCRRVCAKMLSCALHPCPAICHAGDCAACIQPIARSCLCGAQSRRMPCSQPPWQCDRICGRLLDCGKHKCELLCHAPGACGPCPRQRRTCPCGKSQQQLSCTEEAVSCGDTCDRLLACGQHRCTERCHSGACGLCRKSVDRACRCGQKRSTVQCSSGKDGFLCNSRCQRMRNCGRHECRRRCCDGQCPPCSVDCALPLGCGSHKCQSVCHGGACYPCTERVTLSCPCGDTRITLPCGRQRNAKLPRCRSVCRKPPECHHQQRIAHLCHSGDCPPCEQVCKMPLPCGHECTQVCHTGILVIIQPSLERAGPWVPVAPARRELQNRPCPPCTTAVNVSCAGSHERADLPCHTVNRFCCGQPCGRLLACTNHTCSLPCHAVEEPRYQDPTGPADAGRCESCVSRCLKPRPSGCEHACLLGCHPGPCAECRQMVSTKCYCAAQTVVRVQCAHWNPATATAAAANAAEQLQAVRLGLRNCGGVCLKPLTCGHPCPRACHADPCGPVACKRKVTVRCGCKRRKAQAVCSDAAAATLQCDEQCAAEASRQPATNADTAGRDEIDELLLRRRQRAKERKGGAAGGNKSGAKAAKSGWLRGRCTAEMLVSAVLAVIVLLAALMLWLLQS